MRSTLSKYLDATATVLMIVVSCGFLYSTMTERGICRTPATVTARQHDRAAEIKGRVVNMKGLASGYSGNTVVVSLSTHCQFCIASKPFYARLVEMFGPSGELSGRARLVFTGLQPIEEFHNVFPELNRPGVTYLQATESPAGTRSTPTILIADSEEKVREVFIGKLPPEREESLIAVLRGDD